MYYFPKQYYISLQTRFCLLMVPINPIFPHLLKLNVYQHNLLCITLPNAGNENSSVLGFFLNNQLIKTNVQIKKFHSLKKVKTKTILG